MGGALLQNSDALILITLQTSDNELNSVNDELAEFYRIVKDVRQKTDVRLRYYVVSNKQELMELFQTDEKASQKEWLTINRSKIIIID